MKMTRRWLEDWVRLPAQDAVFARHLTEAGLEVEAVETLKAPFSGVCVARIESAHPHPSLTHLAVYQVTTGSEQAQVISAAPNLRVGMQVPWASVDARLPAIGRIGIRWFDGIASQGMLCSESELGLGRRADGILELPDSHPVGADLAQVLGWPDVLYEINVTPNRGDCLSALGIAREVSAIGREALKRSIPPWSRNLPAGWPVTLTASDACPSLALLSIEVSVEGETPLWLKVRLGRLGLVSVHPVVDVTQYVMMELGQPTHAYDADQIRQQRIDVRWGHKGETCRLLNNQDVVLDENVLVITDSQAVLGIAGIMGGAATSVRSGSRRFMIESAHFTPEAVAGRSRRLGLATEAAARYERGVDPELPLVALERIAVLLSEIYGNEIRFLGLTRAGDFRADPPSILCSRSLFADRLGMQIKTPTIRRCLAAVGCALQDEADQLRVTPPSHRFDLSRPIDLVEEVARLVGYDRLPEEALQGPIRRLPSRAAAVSTQPWAHHLVCRGYQETIHMPFVDPRLDGDFSPGSAPAVVLRNPLAQDQSVLRRSLWPSLIETLRYNLAREQKRIRIFEIGSIFEEVDAHSTERLAAAGLWHGLYRQEQWGMAPREVDFFDVKADVESLLEPAQNVLEFMPCENPVLDPAESAAVTLHGKRLGMLGAVHPALQKRWELRAKTYIWSLNMIDLGSFINVEYKPVPRFPAVRRDLAFILPETVPFHDIREALLEHGQPLLQEIKLFDLYTGPGLQPGFRSLAFSLLFRDPDSTLTEQVVNELCARLVSIIERGFRGKLRQ